MNEKIKELAEQANIKYSTRDDDFYSAAFDGVHRPDMERFAELIVRECATICKDTAEKQFNPLFSRESDGADVCYRKILEQFGVEE